MSNKAEQFRLDDIESNIKKHNCPCGFSCDDDTYFQVHVIREHQVLELEIPQGAPIDPKFIDVFLRENGYDPQEVGERFERVAREALKKARERMEQTND